MQWKSDGHFFETKEYVLKVTDVKYNANYYIKRFLYPFFNLYYKLLQLRFEPPKYNKKYKVVVCTIFKNEALYFREWIEFHSMLGVEHFYLYNNNSTDNYLEVLEPYISKGMVTLTDWPAIPGQISAYKHWYDNYRQESQWASFLDLDEYVCPLYDYDIPSMLQRFPKYPVLIMEWLIFGTSGRVTEDTNQLLIEQFTHCWNHSCPTGKIWYNTDYDIASFDNGMHHRLKVLHQGKKIPPINESGNFVIWSVVSIQSKEKHVVQLNHYISRSYESMKAKVNKGSSAYKTTWKTMDLAIQKEYNCKNVDYSIQRFLLLLKLKMNEG